MKIWLITLIIVAMIIYGSLYPFEFRIPSDGPGPMVVFLGSWSARPGFGDFLANILLYLPFGCFCLTGLRRNSGVIVSVALTAFTGAALSLCIELTQYYDVGRDTEATDFYANTIGSFLGAIGALGASAMFDARLSGDVAARPVSLIFAWLAYRLYPYVPTINLHKYWNALKPVVLWPSLGGYDLFRQTAIWLTLCALIDAVVRGRHSTRLMPLFAVTALGAKVLIIDTELRVAELAGFACAFGLWLCLLYLPLRARTWVVSVVLCGYVIALRLEPFRFQPVARPFGWIPFYSLMFGSLTADTLAFLEKFFLYGSMLYLLRNASGRGWWFSTALAAVLLSVTSWLETYLPGRSAEITDTLMVLIIAVIFALLPPESRRSPGPGKNSLACHGDPR